MINHNIERNMKNVKDLDRITIGTQYEFIGSDVADYELIYVINGNVIGGISDAKLVGIKILKTDGTLYQHYGLDFTVIYKNKESLSEEE